MRDRSKPQLDKDSPKVNRRLTMKYTKEERLDIGRRIYDGEITRYQAAEEYGISDQTARDYMRLYRSANQLPPKHRGRNTNHISSVNATPVGMEEFESMTKEELIHQLMLARIRETRLKKGYEVKGDGTVIRYVSKNTK